MSAASPADTARRAIRLLDLTELGDTATDDDVTALCSRAISPQGSVAAVCVWPRHVALARHHVAAHGVRVATVVNFPSGNDSIDDVVALTNAALGDGADEIDLVLPYRAFLAGDTAHAAAMIDAVRAASAGHTLKVILETGELTDPAAIRSAAQLAVAHGADFIKTSTGKTPTSASLEATAIMLDVICNVAHVVGLKPSGGIRTLADAVAYLDQADAVMGPDWATPATFRFGASGLLTALQAACEGDTGAASQDGY